MQLRRSSSAAKWACKHDACPFHVSVSGRVFISTMDLSHNHALNHLGIGRRHEGITHNNK
ncbi:hypothetical protein H257_12459, partial [Aphanomyces astaci]